MPRPPSVDYKEMLRVLRKLDIFDEKGDLKPRNDIVWTYAAQKFCITPGTVHGYVRLNRGNLLNNLREYHEIEIKEILSSTVNSTLDSSGSVNGYEERDVKTCVKKDAPKLMFQLNLSEAEWRSIHPVSKTYREKGRNMKSYTLLQDGWTDLISRATFAKTKLPCAYSFKYGKVYPEGRFLNILGHCTDCGATITGHCMEEPQAEDGICVSVTTVDTRGIPHDRKRALKGKARELVAAELLHTKPRKLRQEAMQNLSFKDVEPSYLPRKDTLRKVKEEAVNKDLGIDQNMNVVDSLLAIKYDGKRTGNVQYVAADPFCCMYVSLMQITVYKTLIKKYQKVELDATGSLVKSIKKPNGERNHIFLYQMVIRGDDGVIPVLQMLSERNDVNQISFWLKEHLRAGAPVPKEANMDCSFALLNATSLAYNERSLKHYLQDCFYLMENEELQHPLSCYIRVDIAHFMHTITSKGIFKGRHPKVKDFYARCVGIMTTANKKADFDKLLLSTMIVALAQHDGKDDTGADLASTKKQEYLLDRIKTYEEPEEVHMQETDDEMDQQTEYPEDVDSIKSHVCSIKDRAKAVVDSMPTTERLNPYYLPQFADTLQQQANYFPLWSNVLGEYFKCSTAASSARCEEYFKDLKEADVTEHNRLRADKFVVKHIRSIESICKLERAAQKSSSHRKRAAVEETDSDNELNIQENWRGKNVDAKKTADSKRKTSDRQATNDVEADTDIEEEPQAEDGICVSVTTVDTRGIPHARMRALKGKAQEGRSRATAYKAEEAMYNPSFEDGEPSYLPWKEEEAVNKDLGIDQNMNVADSLLGLRGRQETSQAKFIDAPRTVDKGEAAKRGKYLKPCPEIDLIHDRPARRRRDDIISNGAKCPPIMVNGEKVYVQYTCAFDSILEVMTSGYNNYASEKSAIDEWEETLFKSIIQSYSSGSINQALYMERASILCPLNDNIHGYVDCWTNVNNLITILLKEIPSMRESEDCSNCGVKNNVHVTIQNWSLGFETERSFGAAFEDYYQNYFNDEHGICKRCKSETYLTRTAGSRIIFDIEGSFERQNYPQHIFLDEVPVKIVVSKEYILSGVIEYRPNHYVSLTRDVRGVWTEQDDLSGRAQLVPNAKTRKVKLSTLIYVKL